MRPSDRRAWRTRPLLVPVLCLLLTAASVGMACASALITRVEARRVGQGAALSLLVPDGRDLQVYAFTLDDPSRLIFDVKEAALARGLQSSLPLRLPGLSAARLGQFRSDPDVVRIVLDLADNTPPPTWKVVRGSRSGETLLVFGSAGPVMLPLPRVEKHGRGVAVRLAGAGSLRRRTAALDDPPRVFTDLANAELEVNCRTGFATGPIREIRMAQQAPDGETSVARLVIELREPQAFSESVESDDLLIGFGQPAPPPARPTPKPLKGRIIVVDPGHGGTDPGSIGAEAETDEVVYEKDLTLDLALRLAEQLKAAGAEVTLTRDQDVFTKPSQRAQLANELGAEALVSIHCNSCSTPNALCGSMVLYHSPDSLPLAQAVEEELVAAWGTQDRGVRLRDDLTLLKRTEAPSIIVETAFINHDEDRLLLLDPDLREKAARAILQGVIRFFSETTAPGAQSQ